MLNPGQVVISPWYIHDDYQSSYTSSNIRNANPRDQHPRTLNWVHKKGESVILTDNLNRSKYVA